MNILHLYPKDDTMLSAFAHLIGGTEKVSSPDIVHIHGCWNQAVCQEIKRYPHARLVLSPHGQLQSWILDKKNPLEQAQQRKLVKRCFAITARSKMEYEQLSAIAWNPRIEVVSNPQLTVTTTPERTRERMYAVYQKVMDSHVWELMTDESRRMMACLLKAGITGDRRWVRQEMPADVNWRHIMLYAQQESVNHIVQRGINVLSLQIPDDIDVNKYPFYLPQDYHAPAPLQQDITTIVAAIQERPCIYYLTELHQALMRNDIDDNDIHMSLKDNHLLGYAQRLMSIMSDLILLDKGYMPVDPITDKQTDQIRNKIANHLSI